MPVAFRSRRSSIGRGEIYYTAGGIVAGDLLLVHASGVTAVTLQPGSSWTTLVASTDLGGRYRGVVYKVATQQDVIDTNNGLAIGSFTAEVVMDAFAYSGVQGNPTATVGTIANTASITAPAVTSYAGDVVALLYWTANGQGPSYWGVPAGTVRRYMPDTGTTEYRDNDNGSSHTGIYVQGLAERQGAGSTSHTATWGSSAGVADRTDNALGVSVLMRGNQAPNAPTLTSPTGGVTIDRTAAQRFSWAFSDPDAGDTQSAYSLQYRIAGSGSAWTVVSASTPSQFRDFAGSTFAAGNYEWQVRTTDAAGLVGPYSASGLFTAATPPAGPTITAPTNGSTLNATPTTVTWSASSQEAYQIRRVADNAGSPDTATIYYDSGEVTSTTARSLSVAFPTNDRYEHVQLRVRSSGLWSAYTSVRVLVSYTPPEAPTLDTVTASNATASIVVGYAHRPNVLSANVASVETDTTGFASGGNATLARSTGEVTAVDGTAVLKLTLPAAGNSNFRLPVTRPAAAPGQVWTARFAVRSNVSRSVQCNIRFINAAGTVTLATATATATTTTTGWTVVQATGTAPADTGLIDVLPQILSGATTDAHYFDAFALRQGDGRNVLLPSGSFETDSNGWSTSSNTPTVSRTQDGASHGSWSLRVVSTVAGTMRASTAGSAFYTPVVAGETVWFSFDVKPETTSRGVIPQAQFYDATYTLVGGLVSATYTPAAAPAAGVWTRINGSFVVPAGAAFLRPYLGVTGTAIGDSFLFDAVQIERASTATAYTNPLPWTPGGTPAANYVDVHRRDTVTGEELRIATGQPTVGTYTDRTPGSGRPYEYRVTAVAANSTTAVSPWTA